MILDLLNCGLPYDTSYRWQLAQFHAYQEQYWRELSETGDDAPEDLVSWQERSEWHGKLARRYRADLLMFWRDLCHLLEPESADDEPLRAVNGVSLQAASTDPKSSHELEREPSSIAIR